MTWKATVFTLFPEMFPGPLGISLLGKALQNKLWQLDVHDIRDFGVGKHKTVDDTPSGGGPGMVMRADVALAAIDSIKKGKRPLVYPSPRGPRLTQERVATLAKGPGIVLLCGRFEGLDQRAIDARQIEEWSLGDFVLAGGEIAAMAVIEAAVRLIPGVLGAKDSTADESFSNGLLEYPQYTRPQLVEDRGIPAVLNNGNHKEIASWRRAEAEKITKERRPDLWAAYDKPKT
ncbi:MAG: tRNA (guanosine(37)-N1)-methyltransferase TrmD [Alphaproteobacteria bacterium]|nr:tRNA (guanosine(37)-N1)-methyltransferase TrmD [Alphaproteobacteria bacterium]MBV9905232.1 tRNA (guanosine(37)-N1)-methyltransferase TrmD [Alphaproteobacteria bacterium]